MSATGTLGMRQEWRMKLQSLCSAEQSGEITLRETERQGPRLGYRDPEGSLRVFQRVISKMFKHKKSPKASLI